MSMFILALVYKKLKVGNEDFIFLRKSKKPIGDK